MIKSILKRGLLGILISISLTVIVLLAILLLNGYSSITLDITILTKYFTSSVIIGFIAFAGSVLFDIEKWSLIIRTLVHFVITYIPIIHFIKYAGWIPNSTLYQAEFLSLYVLFYILHFFWYVTNNKKDAAYLNEQLQKIGVKK
ncbi:DUF3021 domain-containing protein [Inconstantimicrobium mannanitabidum]|uniref:Uncharacterized protein n=1 Tax=Inconstantimicrobium mannanitabidum TaxID=1604901 RepID=A0ACB5RGY4_9CLOT|nr:DUF3021 domain-containing protein [Clostridium sp. TW13]GKX68331.1 hypothetical protein rsdtw13_35890 [Clostridium sp. TW13]